MDGIFLLKLAVCFFIGAFWVTLTTVLADRYGSKIGGLIAGLPSTLLLSLFFIAWTQSGQAAVEATTLVPVVGGIDCLFVVTYALLVKKNFWFAFFSSYITWLVFSFVALYSQMSFTISLFWYFVLLAISYYILHNFLKVPSLVAGKKTVIPAKLLLLRALLGGTIVSFATLIAKTGGPTLGGVFGMFPAMFASTILITYFSNGADFSVSTMKSSLVSALSVIVFVVCARWSYGNFSLFYATLIPTIASYTFGYFNYLLIMRKGV